MGRQYRTREGQVTAIDTKTALATVGSEAAPGALLVPQGARLLAGVYVASAGDMSATGSATALVRLEGPGLPNGPEVIVAGAHGVTVATGGQDAVPPAYVPLSVRVTPGNEILVFGEMAGADVGLLSIGCTLVFI